MRILVLGGGAREHALWWKCRQSPLVDQVYAAPGNGATQAIGASVLIDPTDPAEVLALVYERDIDLVVIGPDDVVAAGVADHLGRTGRAVFGPNAAAGRIESSKAFAKDVMRSARIPTAEYEVFDDPVVARAYAREWSHGLVVKADGLALGKGVVVCDTVEDTLRAIDAAMVNGAFGDAGRTVILEERISGPEVSLMCFCDGVRAVAMEPARDYKRARDGDTGPNTGGMGVYSPPSDGDDDMRNHILRDCAQPVLDELARRGILYQGCLYVQVMLTDSGPRVIEYNARFGDPEAQVVLPRLRTDLVEVMLACSQGDLASVELEWDQRPAVGVVLASGGYPGKYTQGSLISGLNRLDDDVLTFHAGTRHSPQGFITSGGRVLTLVAMGDSVEEAHRRAYDNVARVSFDGAQYRKDIAGVELATAGIPLPGAESIK